MPAQVIGINEFFKRFLNEAVDNNIPKRKFVWIIGAGASVSSGIPVAKEVSNRIILLEYFNAVRNFPWVTEDDTKNEDFNIDLDLDEFPYGKTYEGIYKEKNLHKYFDWYEDLKNLDTYLLEAFEWLSKIEPFHRITPDIPHGVRICAKRYKKRVSKVRFESTKT